MKAGKPFGKKWRGEEEMAKKKAEEAGKSSIPAPKFLRQPTPEDLCLSPMEKQSLSDLIDRDERSAEVISWRRAGW